MISFFANFFFFLVFSVWYLPFFYQKLKAVLKMVNGLPLLMVGVHLCKNIMDVEWWQLGSFPKRSEQYGKILPVTFVVKEEFH